MNAANAAPECATMSAKDASALLGVPVRSIYEHIKKGVLPSISIGRRRLVVRSGVEAMIANALHPQPVGADDV